MPSLGQLCKPPTDSKAGAETPISEPSSLDSPGRFVLSPATRREDSGLRHHCQVTISTSCSLTSPWVALPWLGTARPQHRASHPHGSGSEQPQSSHAASWWSNTPETQSLEGCLPFWVKPWGTEWTKAAASGRWLCYIFPPAQQTASCLLQQLDMAAWEGVRQGAKAALRLPKQPLHPRWLQVTASQHLRATSPGSLPQPRPL